MKSILIFLLIFPSLAIAQQESKNTFVMMFGPMIHFRTIDKKIKASYGLEVSYWKYNSLIGFDLGAEWEKGKIRTYSEVQAGIIYTGCALGPVYEYDYKLNKSSIGVQGSVWANLFVGVDARLRYMNRHTLFTPGTYLKLPIFHDLDLDIE